MSTVQIDIELVTSSFKTALTQATNQTQVFSQKAKTNFDLVKSSFVTMAGVLAANGLTSVVSSITNAFRSVINEAAQSEEAINNLNIALRTAGLYSSASSQEMQDFASSMQAITVYGDEAVLAASGLLLSLTTLNTKGVQAATIAAANLAATLGIDLQSATEMISKAVNGNTIAFNKLGIEIQKGNTDAERLENTLNALQNQSGAAEAQTKTYSGAIAQLGNAQGDLLKTVGKLITQNSVFISAISATSDAFSNAANWVQDNKQFLNDLAKTIIYTSGVVLAAATVWGIYTFATTSAFASTVALASAISGASIVTTLLSAAATTAWAAITGPIGLVVISIAAIGTAIYALIKNWDNLKIAIYSTVAATLEYAAKAASLVSNGAAASLNLEAQAWRDKAQVIRDSKNAVVEATQVDAEQQAIRTQNLAKELAEVQRINAQKTALAIQQRESLSLISLDQFLTEQEQQAIHEQEMLTIKSQFDTQALTSQQATLELQLLNRQAYEQQLLQVQIDADLAKAVAEEDHEARQKAIEAANNKAAIDRAKLQSKQEIDVLKLRNKSEAQLAANKIANQKDTFATIATLSNSNNKQLAAIGKAAAITQIAIDTPVAISKALAAFPPPANFVAAGVVGVAMAAQAANIAGVKFADGGIVPGSSNSGDRIRASLNSGEMVLNRNQQAHLFKIANQGINTEGTKDHETTNALLADLITAVKTSTSINIDGKELFRVVRDELSAGRSLA